MNNAAVSECSDTGPGTYANPFCTISAAVKVVQPGQTVRIASGKPYDEAVTISRSGQPGKPITFIGGTSPNVGQFSLAAGKGLTVTGASHVAVRGMYATAGLKITGSTDVELEQFHIGGNDPDSLTIDGGSANVRLIRSQLATSVRIEGAQGTVLSRNRLHGYVDAAVTSFDAPGTVVTNNTIYLECEAAVSLGGASTASALFNNLIHTGSDAGCPAPGPRYGITVAQSAAAGTRADSNLITGPFSDARVAYKWAGTPTRSRPPSTPRPARAPTTS